MQVQLLTQKNLSSSPDRGNPVAVREVEPAAGTLIDSAYDEPDYRDAFVVDCDLTADEFATAFFLGQPRWIAKVSMNLGDRASRQAAIAESGYREGTAVGSWRVHARSDNEIVFGEHMGFMEYRFSVRQRAAGEIEASTAVHYRRRFAHVYFGLVRPFHRAFIPKALRNAGREIAERGAPQ